MLFGILAFAVGWATILNCPMNLEGIIPLLGGIYCTLLGFRVVAPGKNRERNEQWLKKFGPFMRIGGPFLIIFGFVQLLGLLK